MCLQSVGRTGRGEACGRPVAGCGAGPWLRRQERRRHDQAGALSVLVWKAGIGQHNRWRRPQEGKMADLKLTEVRKAYGTLEILHGINLDIKAGEFIVFVGPSGYGKSTLLRTIAGLEQITGGTLEIGGQVVNDV